MQWKSVCEIQMAILMHRYVYDLVFPTNSSCTFIRIWVKEFLGDIKNFFYIEVLSIKCKNLSV